MPVLVTGGTGFIGSHQVVALLTSGHDVVVVDNSTNSHSSAVINRIEMVCGMRPEFHSLDVRATDELEDLMSERNVSSIIHFAALKHVGESVERPIEYYRTNIDGLGSVLEAAENAGVRKMVFSSSGSVYGHADTLPIPESAPHRPTNPYSTTKSVGEQMLRSLCDADPAWSVIALRYFNPAGAHASGLIGEDPVGLWSNLLPGLMDVAMGCAEAISIFGDDYPTPDGTGVRDYIHVVDVAEAHVRALDRLENGAGFEAINIGRGEGISVNQLRSAVEQVTGRPIKANVQPRRPGDVAALFGDGRLAAERLGMTSYLSLHDICADAWRWRTQNPGGYIVESSAPILTENESRNRT